MASAQISWDGLNKFESCVVTVNFEISLELGINFNRENFKVNLFMMAAGKSRGD